MVRRRSVKADIAGSSPAPAANAAGVVSTPAQWLDALAGPAADAPYPRYYARNGAPITQEQWAQGLGDMTRKRVALTTLRDGTTVSTVWLGLDHQYGVGPPLIFETMVFLPDSYSELDMERYSTEAEALQGHRRMVRRWRAKRAREVRQ